jgi:penicillin-binding protein 1A
MNKKSIAKWARRFALVGCLLLAGAIYGLLWLHSLEARLPDVRSLADVRVNPVTTIVSSDGVTLATLVTQDRHPLPLRAMSPYVLKATVATEDARFRQHHGVDGRGIFRALLANLVGGKLRGQGGSTITQQLARNLYLSREKTFTRKVEEVLLARKIERSYSKDDILEAYLNTIYYGSGCYGIEAAAQEYLGKSAASLTLGEAALLAGLPQRPAAFAPNQHLESAQRRQGEVLRRMVAAGYISAEQSDAARRQIVHILPLRSQNVIAWKAPYFVSEVITALRQRYGPEFVYSGARIETSLNWRMQQAAEGALCGRLKSGIANTGALVAVEPQTGYVRALVGGPNFRRSEFDAATQGIRQPGSAFKPLVYLTAFDTGVCNLISVYQDQKRVYPNEGQDYVVHNYDGTYHGAVTVLEALQRSINTVAVQVGAAADPSRVIDYAQRFGISTPLTPGLPLALGSSGVRPIELCSAYTAFANRGIRYDPVMITAISDARGHSVWQDEAARRQHNRFVKTQTLDQINVALREVVTHGTAEAAVEIPDAHGKTGTTSDHRDAWFVGYTGTLATAVWVAREHRSTSRGENGMPHTVTRYEPMADATGGSLCVPIWTTFMRTTLQVQAGQAGKDQARAAGLQHVAAPERAAMVAALRAEASRIAAAAHAATNNNAQTASDAVPVMPAGFIPAQDGSGPMVVTAPPDTPPPPPNMPSPPSDTDTGTPDNQADQQATPAQGAETEPVSGK